MKNVLRAIIKFFKRFYRALFSRAGVITLGVLSFIFVDLTVNLLLLAGISYNNPSALCGADFRALRQEVLDTGHEEDPLTHHEYFGSSFSAVDKVEGEKTYTVFVSTSSTYSNYLAVVTKEAYKGYGLAISFSTGWMTRETYANDSEYAFMVEIGLLQEDLTPFILEPFNSPLLYSVIYASDPAFNLVKESELASSPEDIKIDPAIIEEINVTADDVAKEFLTHVKPVLRQFKSNKVELILIELKGALREIQIYTMCLFFTVLLTLLGGPLLCLFFLTLITRIQWRKKRRLIATGKFPEETVEDPPNAEEIEAKRRKDPYEIFVAKTHLRPIIGEWLLRGFGFALLILGSIFTTLINSNSLTGPLADSYALFNTLNTMGSFILVIALIGVIAESRQGLRLSSAVFFVLAFTYYFALNSILFFIDSLYKFDFEGVSFSSMISAMMPGNIFMSMGLFTFIGLFLFEEPPEWVIPRKVFRALSAIPTSIAIMSVILSLLWKTGILFPNYWVSSLFFVRDFDGLFVGVLYIYVIFIFRSYLSKTRGKQNVDDEMERPAVQFAKNVSLVLIVVAYTILFYCIQGRARTALRLADNTFVYFLIPIFLFYKPAGRKHKMLDNIIYYGIYILAFAIPSIVNFFVGL